MKKITLLSFLVIPFLSDYTATMEHALTKNITDAIHIQQQLYKSVEQEEITERMELFDVIPDETKQLYVKDKVVTALPKEVWDITDPKEFIKVLATSIGIGSLTFGFVESHIAIASLCICPNPAFQMPYIAVSGGVGVLSCLLSSIVQVGLNSSC